MIDSVDLLIAAHFALPVAAILLLAKALHLRFARRLSLSRSGGARTGLEWAVLSARAGLLAYIPGLWTGFGMDGSTAPCGRAVGDRTAGEGRSGELLVVERMLPLSRECRWGEGTSVELVPFWLNAVVFAALAGMAVGGASAVRHLVRASRAVEPRRR